MPLSRGCEIVPLQIPVRIGPADEVKELLFAPLPGSHGGDDLLRRCDQALYRAKRQGRNRVTGYEG